MLSAMLILLLYYFAKIGFTPNTYIDFLLTQHTSDLLILNFAHPNSAS